MFQGANEQLSLTDFLLDFLLSLWVPLNYAPSQQVLNTPDPAKRDQMMSIEKSKIALNNYINHLLRYADENGGLVNGQIPDSTKFLLDPNLLFPENGQMDGQDISQPNIISPSDPSTFFPSGGSPNLVPPYVPPSAPSNYMTPNCKPTSFSCDNPVVPNQNGHPSEYHPTHIYHNNLHNAHVHQPFFHPSHLHTHHTSPVGIDGNDISVTNSLPSDNFQVVPDTDIPSTGGYPVPPTDLNPTNGIYDAFCNPLDPKLIFNPSLCANVIMPYHPQVPYTQSGNIQPPSYMQTLQPSYMQNQQPSYVQNQQPSHMQNQQITNPESLLPQFYQTSQASYLQPPINGPNLLWEGRKRSYLGESMFTFPRKRDSSGNCILFFIFNHCNLIANFPF